MSLQSVIRTRRQEPPPMTPESIEAAKRAAEAERATVLEFPRSLRNKLKAIEHMSAISSLLAKAHWAYEGWTGLAQPLTGEMSSLYKRAASIAVRLCSEPDRRVAEGCAVTWANVNIDRLQAQLAGPDATAQSRERLVAAFIGSAIGIYTHTLANGVDGPRHPLYEALVMRIRTGQDD